MALAEDAASVLEQFIQDVANLPAEIAHLLEEIQAKDSTIEDCKKAIDKRDLSIQKQLKANGMATPVTHDKMLVDHCLGQYDKAQALQKEKCSLSEKATMLLDRQIKRLDLKIRDLQNEGAIAIDPQLPSLLNNASHRLPNLNPNGAASLSSRGPLSTLSGNVGPSTTIANAPIARLVQTNNAAVNNNSPASATGSGSGSARHSSPHLQLPGTQAGAKSSTPGTSSSLNPNRSPSTDPKRRRLNNAVNNLALPPQGSNLRQSSLGPSTPKPLAGTQQSARGSSGGPRTALANNKKPSVAGLAAANGVTGIGGGGATSGPPKNPRLSHLNPAFKHKSSSPSSSARRRPGGGGGGGGGGSSSSRKKSSAATAGAGAGGGGDGATDANASTGTRSEADGENNHPAEGASEMEVVDEDGEGDDSSKWCFCQNVSHGNMVACDNDACKFEWFHWGCVGVTKEPAGKWFCPDCRVGKKEG